MRYNFGLQPSIYLSRSMGSSSPRNFGSEKFAKLNNCQFAASCWQFKQQFSDEQSRFVSPAKMKLAEGGKCDGRKPRKAGQLVESLTKYCSYRTFCLAKL